MRVRIGATIVAFATIALIAPAYGGNVSCASPVRFLGEVKAGNDFLRVLPVKLVFALEAERNAPPNPYGWTIVELPAAAIEEDFVWAANPPYRGLNVRDLTLSYGQTAEQIVKNNPRIFDFYTDATTNAQAESWIRSKLWPGQEPGAPAELPKPQGIGEFKITSYRFATAGSTKIIGAMRFQVTLCLKP